MLFASPMIEKLKPPKPPDTLTGRRVPAGVPSTSATLSGSKVTCGKTLERSLTCTMTLTEEVLGGEPRSRALTVRLKLCSAW